MYFLDGFILIHESVSDFPECEIRKIDDLFLEIVRNFFEANKSEQETKKLYKRE